MDFWEWNTMGAQANHHTYRNLYYEQRSFYRQIIADIVLFWTFR